MAEYSLIRPHRVRTMGLFNLTKHMNLITGITLMLSLTLSCCSLVFLGFFLFNDDELQGKWGVGLLFLSAYLWWIFATLITIQ